MGKAKKQKLSFQDDKAQKFNEIGERLIELMENGVAPWQKSWDIRSSAPIHAQGKAYRGINLFTLAMTSLARGYESRLWLTFNQIKKWGGALENAKGQGVHTLYYMAPKRFTKKDEKTGEEKQGFYAPRYKYSVVFNYDLTKDVKLPKKLQALLEGPPERDNEPMQECELVVTEMTNRPDIQFGPQPCYNSKRDFVRVPNITDFHSSEEYYSTLFHELVHATGHKSRLDRSTLQNANFFGDHQYSEEELVAEFGAAYLCGFCGIEKAVEENSAAYLSTWMKKLKKKPALLVESAQAAQRAADYILGTTFDN